MTTLLRTNTRSREAHRERGNDLFPRALIRWMHEISNADWWSKGHVVVVASLLWGSLLINTKKRGSTTSLSEFEVLVRTGDKNRHHAQYKQVRLVYVRWACVRLQPMRSRKGNALRQTPATHRDWLRCQPLSDFDHAKSQATDDGSPTTLRAPTKPARDIGPLSRN